LSRQIIEFVGSIFFDQQKTAFKNTVPGLNLNVLTNNQKNKMKREK